ncbi:methyltransferase domain-containing protein [Nocardioides marmorisolisilvae]|uniref:Methyltransferase domain-containing protein n=1 Tax=Nocardioides marmorisolisilvae TaxID=1542737 RepID=A0A3N0E0C3_9ACTN|nr:methyltransferase domain-containing protein [Nocardioides marmorisolisilvae]RNL81285.1 methyltransferase domain-containing protein [Nocardioides marmorisolisilvae]
MAEYTLAVSEAEIARYRLMAQTALADEGAQLALAGVVAGATVADVGCGPAAMSVELARMVGPDGCVVAVERAEEARAAARQVIAESGVANVDLREGTATETGIEPGSVDVVMMRHVLAHNGGEEQLIVDHLASLVRPGGAVYLVDVDLTGMRMLDSDPELSDLVQRYADFHGSRGNDPMVGLRLGQLLAEAGLVVESFTGSYAIIEMPPGIRPPLWAARDVMLAQGAVTEADVSRWGAAFDRLDGQPVRPTIFAPSFLGIGRKP